MKPLPTSPVLFGSLILASCAAHGSATKGGNEAGLWPIPLVRVHGLPGLPPSVLPSKPLAGVPAGADSVLLAADSLVGGIPLLAGTRVWFDGDGRACIRRTSASFGGGMILMAVVTTEHGGPGEVARAGEALLAELDQQLLDPSVEWGMPSEGHHGWVILDLAGVNAVAAVETILAMEPWRPLSVDRLVVSGLGPSLAADTWRSRAQDVDLGDSSACFPAP